MIRRVFIDANILVDYLSLRAKQEDRKWAMSVIHHCKSNLNKAFISTHSFMVLFHIVEKQFIDKGVLKSKLEEVFALFNIVNVEPQDMQYAFASPITDFEDAVQLSCALKAKADLLITKNTADFYNTSLPVILPDQFFDFI